MKMKNYKKYLTTAVLSTMALSCYPWGQKGHDTICFIAENHLTDSTKIAVEKLLDGKSIVYYANWMDNASNTPEFAYSKTWHYKNIDEGETFANALLEPKGDVVKAIRIQTATLLSDSVSDEHKAIALKMLIHLVGDIHQPMHIGHRSDRGGNKWFVKYFGSPTNLHSLWDSKLVESAHKWSYTEWQQQIDRATPERIQDIIANGTPEKWGEECFRIATKVYNSTPQEGNLSYNYINNWTPVIESQFLNGGLRLADLLNSIFDSSYEGSNIIVSRN